MFLCLLFLMVYTDRGKPGHKRQLPVIAEFVMVLVRPRLGLLQIFSDIADIFCISQPSVSNIFTTWISMLYHVFKQVLIRWPSKRHLPKCISKYPTTRVIIIIICTELKNEKPSAPSSQKVTWSDYKSNHTFKLLVGITPLGAFSFVCNLYSGAISDRAITIRSGLIEKLEPMDNVMADQGFNLKVRVGNWYEKSFARFLFPKRSEDLVEKMFIQTVKCFSHITVD